MKKLLIVGAVALFASMNAQETETVGFAKGNTFITGAVGFGSEKTGDEKENTFTIAPSAAYFITSNVALGARVGYANTKVEEGNDEVKTDAFTAGVFGRYYWMPASKFSIFAELGANYGTTSTKVTGSDKFI